MQFRRSDTVPAAAAKASISTATGYRLAGDPVKQACAEKVGAFYNWQYHHFDGTPLVMDAWLKCAGLPPFHGPDPKRMQCATQAGAHFDNRTRHFQGSPEAMSGFRACMGWN